MAIFMYAFATSPEIQPLSNVIMYMTEDKDKNLKVDNKIMQI